MRFVILLHILYNSVVFKNKNNKLNQKKDKLNGVYVNDKGKKEENTFMQPS